MHYTLSESAISRGCSRRTRKRDLPSGGDSTLTRCACRIRQVTREND